MAPAAAESVDNAYNNLPAEQIRRIEPAVDHPVSFRAGNAKQLLARGRVNHGRKHFGDVVAAGKHQRVGVRDDLKLGRLIHGSRLIAGFKLAGSDEMPVGRTEIAACRRGEHLRHVAFHKSPGRPHLWVVEVEHASAPGVPFA